MDEKVLSTILKTNPCAALSDRLQQAVNAALEGRELSEEQSYLLAEATYAELPSLCQAASTLRDQGRGRVISFSPKVFIPLTQLCRDLCGYCAFRDRKSTRLNSSHIPLSRMPSSA